METNYKDINYLNNDIKILQLLSESDTQFNKRLEYIRKLEKANIVWEEANRLSTIWYYIKYKKCKYPHTIYQKVISFERN